MLIYIDDSIMLPFWRHNDSIMATMTIKNLPDTIYTQIGNLAKRNRRSLNNEAIVTLERGLKNIEPAEEETLLATIRKRRDEMAAKGIWLTDESLYEAKNEGRP